MKLNDIERKYIDQLPDDFFKTEGVKNIMSYLRYLKSTTLTIKDFNVDRKKYLDDLIPEVIKNNGFIERASDGITIIYSG